MWHAGNLSLAQYLLSFSEFQYFPPCVLSKLGFSRVPSWIYYLFRTWGLSHFFLSESIQISISRIQMKFLSWIPDLYFQQCTKHLWQEGILLSLAPSCQNIQNWKPCSTHSLLWPVSQSSLTIPPPASLLGQTSSLSAFQSLQKLPIRSRYSLLKSVTADHLQNYVQTSSSRWNSKCRGVWPLPTHHIPPILSSLLSFFQTLCLHFQFFWLANPEMPFLHVSCSNIICFVNAFLDPSSPFCTDSIHFTCFYHFT